MATNRNLQWQEVECSGEMPHGRVGETLAVANDAVFMYGGMTDSGDSVNYFDEFFVFRPEVAKWERRELNSSAGSSNAFTATAFHSCVTHKGHLYLFGGCSPEQHHNAVIRVDPETATRQLVQPSSDTDVPAPRYCHSAVVFEEAMYIFGGKSGTRDSNDRMADIFKFDFQSQAWSVVVQQGDIPPPRSAHSAVVCGRKMFVVGGRQIERGCCADIYEYSFDTHTWRRLPDAHAGLERARHSAVLHNGVIAVFGGWNGRRKLNDLYLHSLDGGKEEDAETSIEAAPSRRECHAAVMWRNTMLVFSGRHKLQPLADVQAIRLGPASLVEQARDWLLRARVPIDRRQLPPRLASRLEAWSNIHAVGSPGTPPM
jgi:N-acetylneuraminic acid mutarotase